jgi:hypothetical protein
VTIVLPPPIPTISLRISLPPSGLEGGTSPAGEDELVVEDGAGRAIVESELAEEEVVMREGVDSLVEEVTDGVGV